MLLLCFSNEKIRLAIEQYMGKESDYSSLFARCSQYERILKVCDYDQLRHYSFYDGFGCISQYLNLTTELFLDAHASQATLSQQKMIFFCGIHEMFSKL